MGKRNPKIHYRFTIEQVSRILVALDIAQHTKDLDAADRYNELLIEIGGGLSAWILEGSDGKRRW